MANRAAKELIRISAIGMMAVDEHLLSHGEKGFTLLEILVVIAIISIILSFAVISIDTEEEELNSEAKRLTALMKLAADEALMNSREYRVNFREKSYSFQMLIDGKWHDPSDGIFRPRQLSDGLTLSITIEQEPIPLQKDLSNDKEKSASVLFLSSNEMTPFELVIASNSGLRKTISTLDGEIKSGYDQPDQ